MNSPEPAARRAPVVFAAGIAAVVVMIPVAIVAGLGFFSVLAPRGLLFPILALGGLAIALVMRMAATIRWRARATRDELSVECDLHVRYRGLPRTVLLVGGAMAFGLVMFVLRQRMGIG